MGNFFLHKERISNGFSKAVKEYDACATAQQRISRKMIDLIKRYTVSDNFHNILEIGSGTGYYSNLLLNEFFPDMLVLNDISPTVSECYGSFPPDKIRLLTGDAEQINFPGNQDLVTSCSTFQWLERPADFIQKCFPLLSDSGYLAFSAFGMDNLKEIRAITGNGLKYYTLQEWKQMTATEFEILYADEEFITLSFPDALQTLKHLKKTGVTAVSANRWTKKDLADFCKKYEENFSENGKVNLTYHAIYVIAKKKEKVSLAP